MMSGAAGGLPVQNNHQLSQILQMLMNKLDLIIQNDARNGRNEALGKQP